ncbi:hypothetical protein B0H10DRAFT_1986487 [Mycena sp. CBHHK59/15]|nr:hypothetical protein B0H10DRAFT_1986487 [Mycena sp. CBHHK59/15]
MVIGLSTRSGHPVSALSSSRELFSAWISPFHISIVLKSTRNSMKNYLSRLNQFS